MILKFLMDILPYIGVLFSFSWLVKIINYSIFDYYSNGSGRLGSLIIGTFVFYNQEEVEDETEKSKKVSKKINNICAYVLLAIIGIGVLTLFYLLFI